MVLAVFLMVVHRETAHGSRNCFFSYSLRCYTGFWVCAYFSHYVDIVNIFFPLQYLGLGCWWVQGRRGITLVIRFVTVVYPSVPHEVLRLGPDCRSFLLFRSYDLCEWGVLYQIASCDSFYSLSVEVEVEG
jgi:hypothetical protein